MHRLAAKSTLILTGAYGSGKTECAMALARQYAERGPVTLVDLDFVTPYFRAMDHRDALERDGVRVIAPDPEIAGNDAPALLPETCAALLHPTGQTVVDLGGDPAGAIVIAQFAPLMTEYDLWAVVNFARPTTAEPAQAAAMLRATAEATRLHLSGIVSNTFLGPATTADDILGGLASAQDLAARLDIPVVLCCAPAGFALPLLPLPVLRITPCLHRPWEL